MPPPYFHHARLSSEKVATKALRAAKWDLQAALNDFLSPVYNSDRLLLNQLFDRYKGELLNEAQ